MLIFLTSRYESEGEKGVKTYISAQMIDVGEKSHFSQIMDFFFTASNAQKIKVKSIFHKWEDQMI